MMNAKISLKDDNVHYINKSYVFKSIYNDENECINDTLSDTLGSCKLHQLQKGKSQHFLLYRGETMSPIYFYM